MNITERNSFFLHLLDNPGDTATRRVFADWLEDQGHPRAELIRLQLELEKQDYGNMPRRRQLVERQYELIREHGAMLAQEECEFLRSLGVNLQGIDPQLVPFTRGTTDLLGAFYQGEPASQYFQQLRALHAFMHRQGSALSMQGMIEYGNADYVINAALCKGLHRDGKGGCLLTPGMAARYYPVGIEPWQQRSFMSERAFHECIDLGIPLNQRDSIYQLSPVALFADAHYAPGLSEDAGMVQPGQHREQYYSDAKGIARIGRVILHAHAAGADLDLPIGLRSNMTLLDLVERNEGTDSPNVKLLYDLGASHAHELGFSQSELAM